jgi:hypothetical protein
MAFNHYAKIKRILQQESPGWYIKQINLPTAATTFSGEVKKYDHYYRIYDYNDEPIRYCKFQQLDRLSTVLQIPAQDLPIINL